MILTMNLPLESYDIVIENGCLEKADELLNLNRKVMIVSDDGVPKAYYQSVLEKCKECYLFVFPAGEDSKSLQVYGQILQAMLEKGFTRKDCVIGIGGGVCGDLAGFVAASYMRGIDFYNIPTTTLSQIDSSIGGKTAINFGGYKNMVGAFYQPKKVLVDPDVLKTLTPQQYNSGLVEAAKMALIANKELFELFENKDINENLLTIIIESLKIKKYVVENDEKENGLRKILNFGHTIGHGIEVVKGDLYHGQCVGLGMLAMCDEEVRKHVEVVLNKLNNPLTVTLDYQKVLKAIAHDKKSTSKGIEAIYVKEIGKCEIIKMSLEELSERMKVCVKEV